MSEYHVVHKIQKSGEEGSKFKDELLADNPVQFPEVPERTRNIYKYLRDAKLLDQMIGLHLDPMIDSVCKRLEDEIISLNHSTEYINKMKTKCLQIPDNENIVESEKDIYYAKLSYEAALLCVQATV